MYAPQALIQVSVSKQNLARFGFGNYQFLTDASGRKTLRSAVQSAAVRFSHLSTLTSSFINQSEQKLRQSAEFLTSIFHNCTKQWPAQGN